MSDGPGDRTDDSTDRTDADPFEEIDDEHGTDLFTRTDEADGIGADPFSALEGEEASPADDADLFDRMEVDEVDVDGVWEALDEDVSDLDGTAGASAAAPREATDHVVDKRTYCHRCPYFADPPETACTHEDASILEALGFEEFRVRDCPMVTDDGPRFDRHGRLDE
ncbi:hypothetical protein SAMN04488066_1299 [Halorubrum aquaticum]|uniref:DUF8135 domain-containing protein n=1 Tax=Halorubrum aquaticum TaxID=387340 RepID=A0A1I3CT45_9EURY|nr:hypothetical protein [Halorubrum aquaticum]SFH77670.1 hypothetical protein SAMN04488066_1299 [Halorubrum aquaticum]